MFNIDSSTSFFKYLLFLSRCGGPCQRPHRSYVLISVQVFFNVFFSFAGVPEHVDEHIAFTLLSKASSLAATDDMFDLAMSKAVSGVKKDQMDLSTSKLSKVGKMDT